MINCYASYDRNVFFFLNIYLKQISHEITVFNFFDFIASWVIIENRSVFIERIT